MNQGPQSSLKCLVAQPHVLTIVAASYIPEIEVMDIILLPHANIADAIYVDESTKKLFEQFMIPSNMTSTNMTDIVKKLNEQYQKHFKTLKKTLARIDPTKVAGMKQYKSKIEQSDLLLFLKDVIGLVNHLDACKSIIDVEDIIEITFIILEMLSEWLGPLEDANLVPSEIHNIILSFFLYKGNYIGEMYGQMGILQFHKWKEPEADPAKSKRNYDRAKSYFDKALEMAQMNYQSLTDRNRYYKKNPIEEIEILSYFVYAQSFFGYFKIARENIERIYYLALETRCSLSVSNVFEFYLNCLMTIPPQVSYLAYHQSIDLVEKIYTLFLRNRFIKNAGFEYTKHAEDKKRQLDKLVDAYQKTMEDWGMPYRFQCKSASVTEIIYTMPSATFNKQLQTTFQKICRNPAFKLISISVDKRELRIKFPLDIPFLLIQNVIDEIGKAYLKLQTPQISPMITKGEKNVTSDCPHEVDTSNIPHLEATDLNKDSTDFAATIDAASEEKGNEREKNQNNEKKKEKEAVKRKQPRNSSQKKKASRNRSSAASNRKGTNTDVTQLTSRLGSLLITEAPSEPFLASEFQGAKICKIQNAKNLFVAYAPKPHPKDTFECPKKFDSTIAERFAKQFDVPTLASPVDCNGFKWVTNNKGACLVGKLAREKFRLFPTAVEINAAGETGFFYGRIKDAKHGKKANRYG